MEKKALTSWVYFRKDIPSANADNAAWYWLLMNRNEVFPRDLCAVAELYVDVGYDAIDKKKLLYNLASQKKIFCWRQRVQILFRTNDNAIRLTE